MQMFSMHRLLSALCKICIKVCVKPPPMQFMIPAGELQMLFLRALQHFGVVEQLLRCLSRKHHPFQIKACWWHTHAP